MINQIHLVGFKSFYDASIPMQELTILTGLNSSGKSSIIQALLMIEKAANGEKSIMLDGHGSPDEIRNLHLGQDDVCLSATDISGNMFQVRVPVSGAHTIANSGPSPEFPEILFISAHRFGPRSSMPIYFDQVRRNKIGPNGENLFQVIDEYGDFVLPPAVHHELSEGETLLYNTRGWLTSIAPQTKFQYSIDRKSDTSYGTFNDHRSTNVGFGLSYALPVIVALLLGTIIPKSIVIIENPEAHLHPRGQSEISRLIVHAVQAGAQVLVETHSDHIFDGFRIWTRNLPGFASKVQFHWLALNERGNSDIVSPVLDDDGRLHDWPSGFFDEFEINAAKLL